MLWACTVLSTYRPICPNTYFYGIQVYSILKNIWTEKYFDMVSQVRLNIGSGFGICSKCPRLISHFSGLVVLTVLTL